MAQVQKYPYFKEIELHKLKLDSENPRLPKTLQGKNEAEILEYMLLDASLIELMLAIGKNDFFPGEQLLVIEDEEGFFKVIEGNRRLSALKILNDPELVSVQKIKIQQVLEETNYRPTQIPVLIFEKEEDIHNYLGYRHITGIKEWRLLEKARYLYNLWKNTYSNLPITEASKELAKSIGSRTDYVKRILIGFEIYKKIEDEKFFRIHGLDDTNFHFNYIADSLSRPNIAEYIGVDMKNNSNSIAENIIEENLKNWTCWLFERNVEGRTRLIGDSESLSSLNKILGNDIAKEAFIIKKVSLEDAIELTGEFDDQFLNLINVSLRELENADRLVTKVGINYDNVSFQLKEIRAIALKIGRTLQEREDENELL